MGGTGRGPGETTLSPPGHAPSLAPRPVLSNPEWERLAPLLFCCCSAGALRGYAVAGLLLKVGTPVAQAAKRNREAGTRPGRVQGAGFGVTPALPRAPLTVLAFALTGVGSREPGLVGPRHRPSPCFSRSAGGLSFRPSTAPSAAAQQQHSRAVRQQSNSRANNLPPARVAGHHRTKTAESAQGQG